MFVAVQVILCVHQHNCTSPKINLTDSGMNNNGVVLRFKFLHNACCITKLIPYKHGGDT